jgi:hypothetical protein
MTPSVTPNPAPAQVAVEPQQTQPLRSTTSATQVSDAPQVNPPQGQAPARNVTNTVPNSPQTNAAQTTQNGQNQTTTPQSQQASAKTQGVGGQNQPRPVSQPSTTASNPTPAAQQQQQEHPLASRIFGAAQVLAGGPRYRTSIDPVTGATSRTQVPISGKQLGMAIALEALSGALSGFAQRGPNAEGRAGFAGLQTGQQIGQQRQQADEQQAQQAQADFQRSYQTAHSNLQMLQLARSVGKADYDDHQQLISDNAPMLENLRQEMPQAIVAEGVSEQDAQNVQKYPLNQFLRVPTGTVPRLGADGKQVFTTSTGRIVPEGTPGAFPAWNNTYTLVRSNVKTGLMPNGQPATWVTNGVRWGLISPDVLKASTNASIPISQAITIQHEASALDQAQSDLNNFSGVLKTPNVNLVQAIDANPSLRGALQSFTSRLNATGHNYQLAVADLAKTDPDSAAAIVNLYGGSNNLKAFDQQQAKADEERQPIATLAQAEGIATDPNASAQRKAQAQSFLKVHQRDAANEAYADADARANATIREQEVAFGGGSGTGSNSSGTGPNTSTAAPVTVNTNSLNSLPPALRATVEAVGEGRQAPPTRTSKDGMRLLNAVNQAYPSYDASRYTDYAATRKDFTSGKTATQITALNTALGHLNDMVNSASYSSTLPGVAPVERLFGNQNAINYDSARNNLISELNKAYDAGGLTNEELTRWSGMVNSWTPAAARARGASLVTLLGAKLDGLQNQWNNGAPPGAVAQVRIVTPAAQKVIDWAKQQEAGTPLADQNNSNASSIPSTGQGNTGQSSVQPIVQKSPSTGQTRTSYDGGKTWQYQQ